MSSEPFTYRDGELCCESVPVRRRRLQPRLAADTVIRERETYDQMLAGERVG